MKFSAVLFAGLAAFAPVQAEAEPEPQGFLDDIETFLDGAGSDIANIRTHYDDIKTRVDDIIDNPEGAWSDIQASITGGFQDILQSLSNVAATATNEELAEATSNIARYSSQIADIVAEASEAVENARGDDEDGDSKGSIPTVAVALAGVLGGAALFANL